MYSNLKRNALGQSIRDHLLSNCASNNRQRRAQSFAAPGQVSQAAPIPMARAVATLILDDRHTRCKQNQDAYQKFKQTDSSHAMAGPSNATTGPSNATAPRFSGSGRPGPNPISILLANSHRPPISRRLGKMGSPGGRLSAASDAHGEFASSITDWPTPIWRLMPEASQFCTRRSHRPTHPGGIFAAPCASVRLSPSTRERLRLRKCP